MKKSILLSLFCMIIAIPCVHAETNSENPLLRINTPETREYIEALEAEIAANTPAAETREERQSMINEDYVWQYYEEYGQIIDYLSKELENTTIYNMRFHGTSEINGKTYHNLYMTKERIEEFSLNEKYISDFDFDELKPVMYIRQNDDSYYMLVRDWRDHSLDNFGYGSEQYETTIHQFSNHMFEAWGAYYLVENQKDTPEKPFPEGYKYGLFNLYGVPLSLGVNVNRNKYNITVKGKEYTVVQTCFFDAIEEIGPTNGGIMGMPGCYLFSNPLDLRSLQLRCVYDLDGNEIFPWQRCPDGALGIKNAVAGEMRLEWNGTEAKVTGSEGEVEISFTDMQGRCVERFNATGDFTCRPSRLGHGIYILTARDSRGVRTEKIAVR